MNVEKISSNIVSTKSTVTTMCVIPGIGFFGMLAGEMAMGSGAVGGSVGALIGNEAMYLVPRVKKGLDSVADRLTAYAARLNREASELSDAAKRKKLL